MRPNENRKSMVLDSTPFKKSPRNSIISHTSPYLEEKSFSPRQDIKKEPEKEQKRVSVPDCKIVEPTPVILPDKTDKVINQPKVEQETVKPETEKIKSPEKVEIIQKEVVKDHLENQETPKSLPEIIKPEDQPKKEPETKFPLESQPIEEKVEDVKKDVKENEEKPLKEIERIQNNPKQEIITEPKEVKLSTPIIKLNESIWNETVIAKEKESESLFFKDEPMSKSDDERSDDERRDSIVLEIDRRDSSEIQHERRGSEIESPLLSKLIPKLQLGSKSQPTSPLNRALLSPGGSLQSPKSPNSQAFVSVFGSNDVEDEEGTTQFTIENFVNSFIEKSDKIYDEEKVIIIQSAFRGCLERIVKTIETPREVYEVVYEPKPVLEEEEIVNELFEEETFCENPLFDEEFAFINELYEEVISCENPLFDGSFSLFTNYEEELEFYKELKQNVNIRDIKKGKSLKKNCFYGDDLVHYLKNKYFLCDEDVTFIIQNLMNNYVIKNQKVYKKTFVHEDVYYFVEDCQKDSILNLPENGVYQPMMERDDVIRRIYNTWRQIINQFATISSKKTLKISYALLSTSALFEQLKKDLGLLHKFDPSLLPERERKAFFINIYNIMTIHALILCGRPNSVITKTLFFKTKCYVIGNYKISLDDIEHLILRGGNEIPPQLFIRCLATKNGDELRVPLDSRIHFTLHKATISSPILRFYNPNNLDQDIEISTMIYLQSNVQFQNQEVHIPRIFNTFKKDFGTIQNLLDFISHHGNPNQKKYIAELKTHQNFIIRFSPENLSINEKDKAEILSDQKVEYKEILDNLQYRAYFKKFCKKEFNDENIICYEEIENYQSIQDGNLRFIKAKEIYGLYLKSGAKREINITANPVNKVNDEIQKEENEWREKKEHTSNLRFDLFEEVMKIITTSLIDAYCRFKLTPEYQEMIILQLENKLKGSLQENSAQNEKKVSPYYNSFFETYDKAKEMLYITLEDNTFVISALEKKSARRSDTIAKTSSFIMTNEAKSLNNTKLSASFMVTNK